MIVLVFVSLYFLIEPISCTSIFFLKTCLLCVAFCSSTTMEDIFGNSTIAGSDDLSLCQHFGMGQNGYENFATKRLIACLAGSMIFLLNLNYQS